MSYYKDMPPPPKRAPIRERVNEARATLDEHVPQFFEPTYARKDFYNDSARTFHIILAVVLGLMLLVLGFLAVVRYPAMDNGVPVNAPEEYTPQDMRESCPNCS